MADTLPTVWPADPHTLAKHAILRRYLDAWFPILTRQASTLARQYRNMPNREILFIDGFAGPGEYTNGNEGSPLIALRAAMDHATSFPVPVRMMFIEERPDRFANLQRVLAPQLARASQSPNIRAVEPHPGDCDCVLTALLDDCEQQGIAFGPALAFLDQFGYGAVSMSLISRMLRFGECEVFTYLDYKDMNRWITDPNKAPAFTRAFGSDEWRDAINLPERERRKFLLDRYKVALRDRARGNAKYVTSFAMFDNNDQPLYWLVFATNNLRGLEEMKKAKWYVDGTGEFRFSDRDDPDQLEMFNQTYDQEWLADELRRNLAGRRMTVDKIKEYVLTETPCYLFKAALKSMEVGDSRCVGTVVAPPERRPGTYPDELLDQLTLTFEQSLFP